MIRSSDRHREGAAPNSPSSPAGFALLITLLALFIVSLLGTVFLQVGEIDVAVSAYYRSSTSALFLADSALEVTLDDFRQDWRSDPIDSWFYDWIDQRRWPVAARDPFPSLESTTINGSALVPAAPGDDPYPGEPFRVGAVTGLGSGSYTRIVWLPPTVTPLGANGSSYRVDLRTRAVGAVPATAAPAEVTVDALIGIEMRNSSPWNNGLVLGTGDPSGALLSGEVIVAGSIHAYGGPGAQTLTLGPGSGQINHYNGIGDASALGELAAKVPALGVAQVNGETVGALDAIFRRKDVDLYLEGGYLGEADIPGNGEKEQLDAVYADEPVAGEVHAELSGGYDLDPNTPFPGLGVPYTDPATGAAYSTFANWLSAHSYAFPGGAMDIDSTTESFDYADGLGRGSVSWDAASQVLSIGGVVRVTDIHWGHGGDASGMPVIRYRGSGVIYSTGDARIHSSVYPAGRYLADGSDQDTAVDGNLGLVVSGTARLNHAVGDPARPLHMLSLFAEQRVELNGETNLVGAIVTNHLSANGERARIWQVPRLALIYPAGLPPGQPLTQIGARLIDWVQRR